jgi:hypothetical protein
MAAKGNTWSNDILGLLFNATAIANIADNAGTSPLTNLYVALHTASPGAGGNQTTNEAAYGSYARVPIARTTGGWVVSGGSVDPVANIVFPTAASGSETETHFSVGTTVSGVGVMLYFGPISPTIAVTTGVQPILASSSIITES